ncbi:MAG: glycosyltransferase family 2 protein [Thermoplasmatota archaeon]
MSGKDLSIVIPVYNEEGSVKALYSKLKEELDRLGRSYEIIFVDDGSTDSTLKKIQGLIRKDGRVSVITFYRNFGKANALRAGFENVKGDIVITMDGDLQDDPREIGRFLKKLDEGYDLVSGWKYQRLDPMGKKIPSKFFNWLIRKMTGVKIHDNNCGFKAYRREVVRSLDVYGEFHRYLPVKAHWRGFRVGEIKVKHHKRTTGKSKYGIERLFKGFIDLVTITFLTKYSRSPLHFFARGFVFSMILGSIPMGFSLYYLIADGSNFLNPGTVLGAVLYLFGITTLFVGLTAELLLSAVGTERITRSHYRIISGKGK